MNFSEKDIKLFNNKGIDTLIVEKQIENFKNGFPFLKVVKAATINDGLKKFNNEELEEFIRVYNHYGKQKKIVKFVPASGAASRMFKSLFGFYDNNFSKNELTEQLSDNEPNTIGYALKNINKFAFFKLLSDLSVFKNTDIENEIKTGNWKPIIDAILKEEGLNYGNLPKGLLQFHRYSEKSRTSVQEHLVEAALYSSLNEIAYLHFTVSPEHKVLFQNHINTSKAEFEKKYAVKYKVSFSVQKSSTDTIAVDKNNNAFRNNDDSILFRPGGHGALIENLNDLDADIIFVKNIDNVVPDKFKEETIKYKKIIAGILLDYQNKIFDNIKNIDKGKNSDEFINELEVFLINDLSIVLNDDYKQLPVNEKLNHLKNKLNRPIRVCGMVKNEGEPGGGPFWAKNNDGSISLQIVESSQINLNDNNILEIVKTATHFNPVDLVCAVKDYKGNKFDLTKFIDYKTGFISEKSKNGKFLKALELPGLWNGAMSDWNTIFIEVPLITFNPVKIINDLLRKEHQ